MKNAVIWCTAILSVACFLSTPAIASTVQRAIAQLPEEPDTACYLRQEDGTTIDLSAWCVKDVPTTPLSPSAAFLTNFRSMTQNYPANVRQELNRYADSNKDSAIAAAKTTCRVLKFGGQQAASTRRQALASYNSSSSEAARQQIIHSLAVNQYCPEYTNR